MLPLTTAKNSKKLNFASPKRCFYSDAKWQIFQKKSKFGQIFWSRPIFLLTLVFNICLGHIS